MIASFSYSKKPSIPIWGILTLMLFGVLVMHDTYANEQKASFVPGEVMIQFSPETEADRLLSRAIKSDPPDLAILSPVARLLSDKIRIPLNLSQLLSGGYVLATVDADVLIKRSLAQLSKSDPVTDIQLKEGKLHSMNALRAKEIDVTFFPGSPEYKVIEAKLAGHGDDDFETLMRELAESLDAPFHGKADPRKHLILRLDLREVTVKAVERLRGLSELVESAQLNYISTIMQPF